MKRFCPLVVALQFFLNKNPFASRPTQRSIKEGDVTGAREVRPGTSSDHFHRAVPWSSSHTGPRKIAQEELLKDLLQKRWPAAFRRSETHGGFRFPGFKKFMLCPFFYSEAQGIPNINLHKYQGVGHP